jgi:AcrR family transcriptional regulator
MRSPEPATPDRSTGLRAADGRVPGRRGQATVAKLLEATAGMLQTTSYRDLKVVDIARKAGTSPATFYQYFPDVDAAILMLADETAEEGAALAAPVGRSWEVGEAPETALALAQGFLDFWHRHEAVLRVVDLAIVEGDQRFRAIRTRLLQPVTVALVEAIRSHHAGDGHADANARAAVLVSMLAHVAEHRRGLETWGVETATAAQSMAEIVATTVTGQLVPAL